MLPVHDAQQLTAAFSKVADILIAAEIAPAESFALTPLAVTGLDRRPEPRVMLRIGGQRFALDTVETELLASALRSERAFQGAGHIADLVAEALGQAEALRDQRAEPAPLPFVAHERHAATGLWL